MGGLLYVECLYASRSKKDEWTIGSEEEKKKNALR